MPTFSVIKSIEIEAPLESVKNVLTDFRQWPVWSPWLCTEPDSSVDYVGEPNTMGHGYNWQGELVGSGEMRLAESSDHQLTMDLVFLKPWKSTADIRFDLQEVDINRTHVSWQMDSKLPFFMFFMKKTFVAMIGADYRRGLLMLKDYIETGSVPSTCEVKGITDRESIDYAGVTGHAPIAEIGQAFEKHVPVIKAFAETNDQTQNMTDSWMAVYNRMDIKNQKCNYTFGVATVATPLAEADPSIAAHDTITIGSIKPGQSLKVMHTGSYRHLGNAWATAMAHIRTKKNKMDKNTPPFERYLNHPDTTPEAELLTEIQIPLK